MGNHTLRQRRSVLKPDGVYVASFGQGGGKWFGALGRVFSVAIRSAVNSRHIKALTTGMVPEDVLELNRLLEEGKIVPVIENKYTLDQAPEAFRYLLEGHLKGKQIITVRDDDQASMQEAP